MSDRAEEIARRALDASRFDDASDYERSVTSVAQALRRQDAETREACAVMVEGGLMGDECDATLARIADAIRASASHSNEKGIG